MKIQDTKTVWVAWTNTDLTEGKGEEIPEAVCTMKSTAIRLGKRRGPCGADCRVSAMEIVRIDNKWLMPGLLTYPTASDMEAQKRINREDRIISKAKESGMTDEEIRILKGRRT